MSEKKDDESAGGETYEWAARERVLADERRLRVYGSAKVGGEYGSATPEYHAWREYFRRGGR